MSVTRYSCALDGQGLQDIDPAILIVDIREEIPKLAAATAANARYDGLHLARIARQRLGVTVVFEIHEYDPARRRAVADRACEWARDGWLTIGDRPGQRLRVVCERPPVATSALQWTDRLTIGFAAYALPFWQDIDPARATFTGRAGSALIAPAGNRECFLEAEITAAGPVDALTLAVNGRRFAFEGLALGPGQTLLIGYDDENHRQFMRVGDASALAARTAASADDLLLRPKTPNAVEISADGEVHVTLKGRGLWR